MTQQRNISVSTKGERKRGRPPTTSRNIIVETAVQLVTEYPDQELSIHQLARTLNLSPTALYGYVADKDDLLQLVSTKLLEELAPPIVDDDPWPNQLAVWARSVRNHFLQHPALFRLLGWRRHMSTAWLHQIAVLTRILKQSGRNNEDLAEAVTWVSKALIGAVSMEVEEQTYPFRISEVDIQQLSAHDNSTMAGILPFLTGGDATDHYDALIARIVTSLQNAALPACPLGGGV